MRAINCESLEGNSEKLYMRHYLARVLCSGHWLTQDTSVGMSPHRKEARMLERWTKSKLISVVWRERL